MAWYNDYRPTNFAEVIGQNLVKTVLQNALRQSKVKHGYLLSGPKGVGKTTIARIFANDLNDLIANPQASMDIIELDAASNSGVDNIRQLIDSAQTPPFAGKYKIFIIDEVHMLSKSAMNALLKILEEPPSFLIFLLATTNPEKLLPTVLSRLTKLALTSHTIEDIVTQLEMISTKEKLIIDKESLVLIAKRSSGGQRDAINLLETLASYGLESYSIKETSNLLGLVSSEIFDRVSNTLLTQDFALIKSIIQEIENIGLDGEGFLAQFLDYLLESVFESPSASQALILPVASILDMKLPINTIHSSFALIQAEITKTNIPKFLPNQILTEKKTEKLIPAPNIHEVPIDELATKNDNLNESELAFSLQKNKSEELNPVQEISNLNEKSLGSENSQCFVVETLDVSSLVDSETKMGAENLNLGDQIQETSEAQSISIENQPETSENQIKNYLNEILKLKTCPPPLKIVSNDINIESVVIENLILSISSPIFLPQVKNDKTLKFIKEYLLEKTQKNYQIEVKLRDPNLKNTVTKSKINSGQEQNLVVESEQEITTILPKVSKEKVFYKIYGSSMPENNISDISNLKFFEGVIPTPHTQNSESHVDQWNDEISNIFDF